MNEAIVVILIIALYVGSALIIHWKVKIYILAALIAAAIPVVVLALYDYLDQGYLSHWSMMALYFAVGWGLVSGFVVGLPFFIYRRSRLKSNKELTET